MYRKNCDKCYRPSYSSTEFGTWICPVCENDLTHHPFFDAITFERIHVRALPRQKKLQSYKNQLYSE